MRITRLSQLNELGAHVRRQVEPYREIIEGATEDALAHVARRSGAVRRPEQDAGARLVQWVDSLELANGIRPGEYFAHVANEGVLNGRTRGGILQGQGVRKGWPDYILDLPLGGYHGFRLELKAENAGKPSPDQLEILARLEAVGYRCAVAWGFDDAKNAVASYLDLA